ncbi:peroxidase 60-like [Chenopodium quinoa]|uniref:peroxidase 60-like n=1 Tax=Chenopodium quinoa TaxID=63459 RepID=UPI000B7922C5|nr:peroxidase 60-like [Chenopodium quinoa]
MTLVGQCYGNDKLKVGFYNGKCGAHNIEEFIFKVVQQKIREDPDIVSDLIRLSFHDCFVRGCDASILLEGKHTEQMARVNKRLGGIEDVGEIKKVVEKVCPGVVSCTDVLVIAARAAVFLVS